MKFRATFASVFALTIVSHASVQASPNVVHWLTPPASSSFAVPFDNSPVPPQCPGPLGFPQACNPAPKLDYFGGHVIANAKTYAVMWTSAVDSVVQANIGGFYAGITNTEFFDWMNEYNTFLTATLGTNKGKPGTQQAIGRGVFAPSPASNGVYVITPRVATLKAITDSDIQKELDDQINHGDLPEPDANTLFTIYFPQGYTISLGQYVSCQYFCAYHGTYTRMVGGKTKSVMYSVQPDFKTDCAGGCGSNPDDTGPPNFPGWFKDLCSASSHELMEATTDAEVGLVPATVTANNGNDYPEAWQDIKNGEIGDMCNQSEGAVTSLANNISYVVQKVYSNSTQLCRVTRLASQDFKLYLNPNVASLTAGSSATVALPVFAAATAGAAQTLPLVVTGLPAGVTAKLGTASLATGQQTTLTLSAASATQGYKDVVVVVDATGAAGVRHTAGVLVNVAPPSGQKNDFSIAAAPRMVTIQQGKSGSVTVTTTKVSGSAETATLSASGLPANVTGSFAPGSITTDNGSATYTISVGAGAAAGTSTVTVTGAATSASHSATIALTVTSSPVPDMVLPPLPDLSVLPVADLSVPPAPDLSVPPAGDMAAPPGSDLSTSTPDDLAAPAGSDLLTPPHDISGWVWRDFAGAGGGGGGGGSTGGNGSDMAGSAGGKGGCSLGGSTRADSAGTSIVLALLALAFVARRRRSLLGW